MRRIVADLPQGGQVLVTEWDSGEIEVAWRPEANPRIVWGAPASTELGAVRIEEDDDE